MMYTKITTETLGTISKSGGLHPLGLFPAVIKSRSEEKNSKGRYYYYVEFTSYTGRDKIQTKKALISSEFYFEAGDTVMLDLINWRDNKTKTYSLFLVIVPPADMVSEDA